MKFSANIERNDKALEARARRKAQSMGFIARKSRSPNPLINQGEFMIMDGLSGFPVAGWTFDYSAQDVLNWLAE